MGTSKQLKLLLWKDILVRKRHPGVLALVFGWTIAVFIILYIVRESIYPRYYDACQHKARAMPSNGLFPFVQSFICNIDNKCDKLEDFEEIPTYKTAKLSNILNQLQNTFDNSTIQSTVENLPKTSRLISTVIRGIQSEGFEDIFGSGIKISDLFKNKEKVLQQLKPIFSENVSEILLDAHFKFGHIFELINFQNADNFFDTKKISKMIIFKNPDDIELVITKLMKTDPKKIIDILQTLFTHVDFTRLMKIINEIISDFTNYNFFQDLSEVFNNLLKIPTLYELFPKELKLKDWLPDVILYLEKLNQNNGFQLYKESALKKLESIFGTTPEWNPIKNLIQHTFELIENEPNDLQYDAIVKNFREQIIKINGQDVEPSKQQLIKLVEAVIDVIYQFTDENVDSFRKIGSVFDVIGSLQKPLSNLDTIAEVWKKFPIKWQDCSGKECSDIFFHFLSTTIQFSAKSFDIAVNAIDKYLATLKDISEVNIFTLTGFIEKSGIQRIFNKMPELLYTFVYSYRNKSFEKSIDELYKSNKVNCRDVFRNIIIPSNNETITEDELRDFEKYFCINVFNYPIINENIFLSNFAKIQKIYYDTPVADYSINYSKLFGKMFDLKYTTDKIFSNNLKIKALLNTEWKNNMRKILLEISEIKFDSNTTISRYFKYIPRHLIDLFYDFEAINLVIYDISQILFDFTTDGITNLDENTQKFINIFRKKPYEVSVVLAKILNMNSEMQTFNFNEVCQARYLGVLFLAQEEIVREEICNVDLENLSFIKDVKKLRNQNIVLEDYFSKIIKTLYDLEQNKSLSFNFDLSNLNFTQIINNKNLSTEESVNYAKEQANYIMKNFEISKIKFTLINIEINRLILKLLKGGDVWKILISELKYPNNLLPLVLEKIPFIPIDLLQALKSPNVIFDVVSKVFKEGPNSLCENNYEVSGLYDDNFFYRIHKFSCFLLTGSEIYVSKVLPIRNDTKTLETTLTKEILDYENEIYNFKNQERKKLIEPNWLNPDEIKKTYTEFVETQKKPLILLQTITQTFNQIIDIGSIFYRNTTNCTWCNIGTILVKELNHHLAQASKYVEFICEIPNQNITETLEILLKRFGWEKFQNINLNTSYSVENFDQELHKTIDVLSMQLILFASNSKLQQLPEKCFKEIYNSPRFHNLTTYYEIIQEIAKISRYSTSKMLNVTSISEPFKKVLNYVSQNVPIYKPIKDIFELDTLKKFKEIGINEKTIDEILISNINVNIVNQIKMSENYEKYLKSFYQFNQLFQSNKSNLIYEEFLNVNSLKIAEILFNSTKKVYLESNVNRWQDETITNFNFLSNIFNDLENVLSSGTNIYNIFQKIDFNKLFSGNYNIANLIEGIVDLVKENTLNKFFEAVRQLLKEISPLIQNEVISSDLMLILDTIENMKILKNLGLLHVTYNVSDLIKEWPNARTYFVKDIGLDPFVVNNILDAKIDLMGLFSSYKQLENVESFICNPKELQKFLTFENEQSLDKVIRQICKINFDKIGIIFEVIKYIDFKDILNKIIDLSVDNILTSANLTSIEGMEAIESLKNGITLLPSFSNSISLISNDFSIENSNSTTLSVISPQFLYEASNLFCGRPLIQAPNKLYDVILQANDYSQKYNQTDLNEMKTDFCKNVYKGVINMKGGKILWSYVKLLLKGKIIFTPDIPETRLIIKETNLIFSQLKLFKNMINNILEGTMTFKSVDNNQITKIDDVLKLPIIKVALNEILQHLNITEELNLDTINIKETLPKFSTSNGMNKILQTISEFLNCVTIDRFIGVEDENELEKIAKKLLIKNKFIAGIVFTNFERINRRSTDIKIPNNITYKIRMDIDSVPSTDILKYRFWTPGPEDDFIQDLRYFRGFIQLQDAVDNAFIKLKSHNMPKWNTFTQQIPYSCWTYDYFKSALTISQTFQVCFFFGFIAIIASTVRYIVWEKESGNTIVMKVMGLKYITNHISWFLVACFQMIVVCLVILGILKFGMILPATDTFILLIFLLEFGLATLMFCYMVSAIFNSASLASVGSAIFYLLSFMPYIIIISFEELLDFWLRILTNLSMSTSFCYGCLYMLRYEVQGVGLQWDNIWNTVIIDDPMTFGHALIFLLIDAILYGIIGYLLMKKSQVMDSVFRLGYMHVIEENTYVTFENLFHFDTGENYSENIIQNTNIVYDEPLKVGVNIKKLTKIYNTSKKTVKAIEDIDITLYTGQVTTLLGQNGAGKTTLIKILTGMMPTTSGQIIINNELIQASKTCQYLGVCPQASVLIDSLTPREHLQFYAQLKTSLNAYQVESDVSNMIDSMGLGSLINEPVSNLSEGMRRRLCVAIAFIGKPTLVVLDEPSSGVDPVARRYIWELILHHKEGRTVLLTTHYLDEAELLSDRVVVLHEGKVLYTGSPLTLKHSYGEGYKLTVTYPEVGKNDINNSTIEKLLNMIKHKVSNAYLSNIQGSNANLIIPFTSINGLPNDFEKLCSVLEDNQTDLGFSNFAMNCTTLDKVFLDLCSKADLKNTLKITNTDLTLNGNTTQNSIQLNGINNHSNGVRNSVVGDSHLSVFSSSVEDFGTLEDISSLINTGDKLTGTVLQKFLALSKKRVIHFIQDWRIILCALVLPTIFTAIAMGFSLIRPPNENEFALKLSSDLYKQHSTSFINIDSENSYFINNISSNLNSMSYDNLKNYNPVSRDCKCSNGDQKCSKTSNPVYETLLKMPSVNKTIDWLIETQDEYIERRYGGWSIKSDNISNMVVWFNNKGYHSMPSYLNTLNNAILKFVSDSSITTYSHPLKLSVSQLNSSTVAQHIADVGIAAILLIAFCLVLASNSIYVVQERVNEEKRLQFLCGVSPNLYWITTTFWDLVIVLCSLILAIIVFQIFGLPIYVERENLPAVCILIILFGWATIPFIHILEKLFRDASMANMALFCICIFIGIAEVTCILLIDILGTTKLASDIRNALYEIYLICPQFSFVDGLVQISKNNIQAELLVRFNMDTYTSPFSWDLLGKHYTWMIIVGFLLIIINLIIENGVIRINRKDNRTIYSQDNSCSVELMNLTKYFNSSFGRKVAVDDISLKVPRGQCVGLIGVNGAGKSTTFKILTTELQPDYGQIYLNGRRMDSKPLFTGEMGYCPQSDALDPKLTVNQTLQLYCALRGITNKHDLVNKILKKFELDVYANRRTENLSGGNRRKLCTAVSVLGNTSIILMDEPTSGMDPYSKSIVANTIKQLIKKQRSILLTSHSVEDCENLCQSVVVMINGKIICQGTPQDLKERYGSGYIIFIRISKACEQDKLENLMKEYFPGCKVQSKQYCNSQFIVSNDTKLSDMFRNINIISTHMSIEDYSLVQSSLDQVFINLANKSKEVSEEADSKFSLPNMYSMDVI